MSTFTRFVVACLTVVLLALGGCKKSAEGETASWAANTKTVAELKAQYPGFEPALQARLDEAQKLWDAAEGLSDDAKVDKMAEANATLTKGFVGDLKALPGTMEELRKKRVEAAAQAGDESSRLGAKLAAEDAQKALDRAEASLKAGAKDEASAKAVLDKITADLKTASAAVDNVLKADKKKTDDKAAKEDAKAAAAADAKAAEEAKVAPWKCEFCETENKHDATKCESCGAPKSSPKADGKADGK
jgi:hypothetical protein